MKQKTKATENAEQLRVMPKVLLGPDGHPATGQLLATMQTMVKEATKSEECSPLQEDGAVYCIPGGRMTPELLEKLKALPDSDPSEKPKPRAFVPRPCSACRALREVGTNYSRVYAVRHDGPTIIRYVKCDFCGNTYKQQGG